MPVPPTERVPEIPLAVSNLVMKLLAKNAENRYQSGLGLKTDLEICLKQWQEQGGIDEFKLGEKDFPGQLEIPQKLYGRDRESAQILSAFERVCGGTTELILITGYSGVGKSALVQETQKPLVKHRGYFIGGKFDQFKVNIPYAAVI
jgi:serine/threonine protein kinase